MLAPNRLYKRGIHLRQRLDRWIVLGEIKHKIGSVNIGYGASHFRFTFAISRKSEIDKIDVEQAAEDSLITHAGAAGTASLRDGCAVENDGLAEREGPGRLNL